jgi:hypothetical protein
MDAPTEAEAESTAEDAGESGTDGGSLPNGAGSGSCSLSVAGFQFAGCTACAACWTLVCCKQSNDCLNETTCYGYMACQANCYNGQSPDGAAFDIDGAGGPDGGNAADLCAQSCVPRDAGALWDAFVNCTWPACATPCLCP